MTIRFYIVILILLVNLSCKKDEFKVNGYWLGDYRVEGRKNSFKNSTTKHNGLYRNTVELSRILYFTKDSLVTTELVESENNDFHQYRTEIELKKDSLILKTDEWTMPTKISFTNIRENLLVMEYENSNHNHSIKHFEDHFLKLKEFNMVPNESKISDFLINNPVTLGNRTDRIELQDPYWRHMGVFLQDSLKANYGNNSWYLHSLGNELFLIIGDQVIHISKFEHPILHGYNYRNKSRPIKIQKSDYKYSYEIRDILGEWIVSNNFVDEKEINKIKSIKIEEKNILIIRQHSTDTLQWKLNKFNNKIVFDSNNNSEYSKYWKIENLLPQRIVLKTSVVRTQNNTFIKTIILDKK